MNFKHIKKIPSNKNVRLTKEGLDNLKAELDQLRQERFSVCTRLMNMDPKEKAEYIISNDEMKMLQLNESKVNMMADILRHACRIKKPRQLDNIEVGSTVDLRFGDQILEYTLVYPIEADPSAKKISERSPLGLALLGRKVHEIIHVVTPRGRKDKYEVLAIV